MRTTPNSGQLRYLGISKIERAFPATLKVLKVVLRTKDYGFSQLLLQITNEIGNILWKKELPSYALRVQRMLPLPAFPHVHIKRLVPGLWSNGVEMFEKVRGVMRASRNGASRGGEEGVAVEMGKWFSSVTLDTVGSSGFSYEFRRLESASISGNSNTEEKSSSKLGRIQYNLQYGWSIPDRGDAIYDISLPSRAVPVAKANPPHRPRGVYYETCDCTNNCS